MNPIEGMGMLLDQLMKWKSNAELLTNLSIQAYAPRRGDSEQRACSA